MKEPILSLRATLTLLFAGGAAYVVAITLFISNVIAPVSGELSLQSEAIIEEFVLLKATADSLRDLVTDVFLAVRVSPDSALAILVSAQLPLDRNEATFAPTTLRGIPPQMRMALAVAADQQIGVAGLLDEARAELEVGENDLAIRRINLADSIARTFAVAVADAELSGLVNLLENQRDLGARAEGIGRMVILWLVIGAALLPLALFLVHRRLYRPLGRLDEALASLSTGSFPTVDIEYQDEIGRIASHFNELTPRLKQQAETAHSVTERLGKILDESFNEIYVIEPGSLRILQANSRAQLDIGYAESEIKALGLNDIAPELPEDELRTWLSGEKVEGSRRVYTTLFRRKDGGEYPVEVNLQLSAAEDPPVLLVIARDTSDVAERDAQLAQAQKMEAVGQLTGGVAHDFNNLLAVIIGNSEMIRDDLAVGSELHGMATQVLESAERGASLTHRLLAFSRRQTLQPRVLDLNRMIAGMTDLISRSLGETIEVETVGAGGLWKCEVDPSQMENVLLNLAINARDSMLSGGRLTIETSNVRFDDAYAEKEGVGAGQYVMMAVTDTGTGMAPEIMNRVFEPFFTTKSVGQGSGLGLSMVYGVLKQSRGHVKIYSEIGEGTTVKTYLPRYVGDEPASQEVDDSGTPEGRGETILVVEDNDDVRDYVVVVLKKLGYRAVAVAGGKAALAAFNARATEIDLILTDVILGGDMSGVELAEAVRELRNEVPILYMSGYTENAIVHGGRLDPGVELLEKPFHKDVLARKLRKVLKGSG